MQEQILSRPSGVRGAVRGFIDRVRGGDLGLLPVIAGLVVISTVLQISNSIFLSSPNLVNLMMEAVPVGVMALGIVCVLLVGEIDLSVGSVSGLSAAILAVLFVNRDVPVWIAIAAAVAAGVAIGLVYAAVFNRIGIPSFVITLAGLLAFLGLQLKVLGKAGSINIPFDSALVQFAQTWFVPAWLSYVFVVLAAALVVRHRLPDLCGAARCWTGWPVDGGTCSSAASPSSSESGSPCGTSTGPAASAGCSPSSSGSCSLSTTP